MATLIAFAAVLVSLGAACAGAKLENVHAASLLCSSNEPCIIKLIIGSVTLGDYHHNCAEVVYVVACCCSAVQLSCALHQQYTLQWQATGLG